MWDAFTHVLSKVLTFAWFTGAVLMIATIPACAYKIFSALWEDGDEEQEKGVQERYKGVQ
jgi:predicted outer membrane lipoprotein